MSSLCLACGEVTRSADRRDLSTSASRHVVPLWKEIVGNELEKRKRQVDLDSLLSGFCNPTQVSHMCRRCFYGYEKSLNARTAIEARISKAVDAIASVPTTGVTDETNIAQAAKRGTSSPASAPKRVAHALMFAHAPSTSSSQESQSPGVAVSF